MALLEDPAADDLAAGAGGVDGEHHRIVVIGAGFSGLATAIRAKRRGLDDVVLLEKAHDVGGTWEANTYPGCQCDIPSHVYSLSFAPNPNWSRTFSPQPEIWAYLRRVAEEHDVLRHVRLGVEVVAAKWDDGRRRWVLDTSAGTMTAEILVSAAGGLSEPKTPDLPGLETFAGTTFHSARWNHEHALTGERVAVIGTGASAIQFVPQIQPEVGALQVYQRTPPWVMPNPDRPVRRSERRIYRRFPVVQRIVREATYRWYDGLVTMFRHPALTRLPETVAKRHMARYVKDPELRRKLTPSYRIGCKRILKSNRWYAALAAPNTEVVTSGIAEVRARSIVDLEGVERPVDTIIFGTGFHVSDMPIISRIHGRDGRTMAEAFAATGMEAYLGTTVVGFPNFFILLGPNTGLGHNSVVVMAEAQIGYMLRALDAMARDGLGTIEPRAEVQREYNAWIDRELAGTVWNSGGCASWYMDQRSGRNVVLWPGSTMAFRKRLATFDVADYAVDRTPAPAAI